MRKATSSAEMPAFEPTDYDTKGILKYISKNDKHRRELIEALEGCGSGEVRITEGRIEFGSPQTKDSSGEPLEEICKVCITDFISRFSAWKEPLMVSCYDDAKHIKTIIKNFRQNCYCNWFDNTSTIHVIGPKQIVDEMKESIMGQLNGQERKSIYHIRERREISDDKRQSFTYSDVHRAILRFVSKQTHFLRELEKKFKRLAYVRIEEDSVVITPMKSAPIIPEGGFEDRCIKILKSFFSSFEHWKGEFDRVTVRKQREKNPELFQTTPHEDHFVQWFCDDGVVRVTGTCDQVQRCKKFINDMMKTPESPPQENPLLATGGLLAFARQIDQINQLTKCLGAMSPRTSEGNQAVFGGKSKEDRPETSRGFIFRTTIHSEVLKFIQNIPKFRNELANCKDELAKVELDKDLKVHVIFKERDFTKQQKGVMIKALTGFFAKFDSTILTLDENKWNKAAECLALFDVTDGLYVSRRQDRRIVKIVGLREKVSQRRDEFNDVIYKEAETEDVPVNVFIAHRECDLWKTVAEKCNAQASKIVITTRTPGKLQYEGRREAIDKAKQLLGELSEELCEAKVEGMSDHQLGLLKKCGLSQNEYFQTGKNLMDSIYSTFRHNSINGSLALSESDGEMYLISFEQSHCIKAIDFLRGLIICFTIDLSRQKMRVPLTTICKDVKEKVKDAPIFIDTNIDSKKIAVSCLKQEQSEVEKRVWDIVHAYDVNDVQQFHPMLEEKAKHIAKRHVLFKAKKVEALKQNGQFGLLVTCEKEDLEIVKLNLLDIESSIAVKTESISGFCLYEHIAGDNKHLKVEDETKCSIFLKPNRKVSTPGTVITAVTVTVKVGDILEEKCDAIVNSTGHDLSFSGQISKAICGKYGSHILTALMRDSEWIVKDQVCLCPTKGQVPWKYLLNFATPGIGDLKKYLLNLLNAADKKGITSLALPAIGTGGLGMDPSFVGIYMKEAIHNFCTGQVSCLTDIRVVIYDASLLPGFKDIALSPSSGSIGPVSTGLFATIYGADEKNVEKAAKIFKEVCNSSLGKSVITGIPTIASLQDTLRDICRKHEVNVTWRNNGQECVIEGILEKVLRAKKEIKDQIEADVPHHWSPMASGQQFVRILLHEASEEYRCVRGKFLHSSPRHSRILKIERIQSPDLYKLFKQRVQITRTKNSENSVTRQLFHGTRPEKIDKICGAGFDRNFAGENGTVYGRGVYFAVNSSYSVNYAGSGPIKHMFLVDVITGDFTQGRGEYKDPPEKRNGVLYDSVVDNTGNPTIYVVFRDSSVYPLYLITFQ